MIVDRESGQRSVVSGRVKKAMLLAAGQGTRLRPLTDRVPKCMIPIGGKPILERNIQWLGKFGITEIIINLCHLPDAIRSHLGDGSKWGARIVYSVEREALGTAGGVKNVAWFFDGPFVVWYGDNLSTCDLGRFWRFHQEKGGLATIALFHREDVSQSGIIGLGASDRVVRFLEKPKRDQIFSHWVNAGIYILEPGVLDFIPAEGRPDFGRDIFPLLLDAGHALYGYRMSHDEGLWWIDTPEDLRRVQEVMAATRPPTADRRPRHDR